MNFNQDSDPKLISSNIKKDFCNGFVLNDTLLVEHKPLTSKVYDFLLFVYNKYFANNKLLLFFIIAVMVFLTYRFFNKSNVNKLNEFKLNPLMSENSISGVKKISDDYLTNVIESNQLKSNIFADNMDSYHKHNLNYNDMFADANGEFSSDYQKINVRPPYAIN